MGATLAGTGAVGSAQVIGTQESMFPASSQAGL